MSTVAATSAEQSNEIHAVKPATESATEPVNDVKEQEPTTKNVEQPIENKNESNPIESEEELLVKGKKLMEEENYSDAVSVFSDALELIQKKNIATTIESVKYYFCYGESLLRFVQSKNDLFGAPVRQTQQQLAETAQKEIADSKQETKTSENGKQENDENEDEDDDLKQNNNKQQIMGDTDTSEDREIAWETFEYARAIVEDYLKENENKNGKETQIEQYMIILSKVHAYLGELLLEDENYELALTEYSQAIDIQNKCKNVHCRSKAANHFMACLAAQFGDKLDDALNHCQVALKALIERITVLLKQLNHSFDSNSSQSEMIKIAEEFIKGMDDTMSATEDGKELKELFDVMQDLNERLEEVKQSIKAKELNANNTDTNNNNNNDNNGDVDVMNAGDPLSNLIAGLTSKFGIDPKELEAMEREREREEEEQQNENKNETNTNKKDNVGVTTMGFGNVKKVDDDDEAINELGSFGSKKSKKNSKKRTFDEAGLQDSTTDNDAKKMKLNSGDGTAVPTKTNTE